MSDYLANPGLPAAQHEESDATPRQVMALLAAFVSMLALAGLLVWWIYPRSLADTAGLTMPAFPEPQLQPSPPADMAAFYREEMAFLHGTGWVDRARGIVHVPIGQAMAKVARDGISDWPTAAPPPGSDGAAPTPSARPLAEVAASSGAASPLARRDP